MAKKKVNEIDFAGKKLPIFYGLNDLSALERNEEEIKKDSIGYLKEIVKRGLESGGEKVGKIFQLTNEQFDELVDDSPEAFAEAFKYFKDRQEAFFGGFAEKK